MKLSSKTRLSFLVLIILIGSVVVYATTIGPTGVYDTPWGNFTIGVKTPSITLNGVTRTSWVTVGTVLTELNVTTKYELGANLDVATTINTGYEWSGNAAWFLAGETITQGNFVYVNSTGYLRKADANSSLQVPVIGLALKSITAYTNGPILMEGWVYNAAWGWTPGDYIFLSTTPGGKTQTAPSGSGNQVQVCAIPFSADLIYFDPDMTVLEIT